MKKPAGTHRVREHRERARLSQSALAAAVHLTRQSLSAIEAGRATPGVDVALRLAHALGRSVEELFGSASEGTLSAELAPDDADHEGRVCVGEVRGRWVAHALTSQDGHVSADGLVRRAEPGRVAPLRSEVDLGENLLLMGCARGLGVLADQLNARRGAGRFVWLSRSSTVALEQLGRGAVHLAGVHLVDARTGEANVGDVRRIIQGTSVALVTLARWQIGWVTQSGNPKRIRSAADLSRRGVRLCAREQGSGARRWLDGELRRAGLPAALASAAVHAPGHLDVGRAVAFGAADAGIATLDVARALGLDFVPLGDERYDLCVPLDALAEPRLARLLDALTSAATRRELDALGYDTSGSGERVAELHAA